MRIVFFGTPTDAVPALRALHARDHEIALVVTQPDRRRGRGSATAPSPVKQAALDLGLTVRTPERAVELVDELVAVDADLGVVVAFGQLLPASLLASSRHGFVNLHFSLLPRWRGAAPVERAVLAGDQETGVCVMALDEGLDTGPVYDCVRTPIGADESAGALRSRLVELGTELLVRIVPEIPAREPQPQQGASTHAAKLEVAQFRLDPTRPADELVRIVRAGNPRPGAWAVVEGRRLKVLRAHVGAESPGTDAPVTDTPEAPIRRPGAVGRDGAMGTGAGLLVLDEVQPEGRAVMSGAAWRAGVQAGDLGLDDPVLDDPVSDDPVSDDRASDDRASDDRASDDRAAEATQP